MSKQPIWGARSLNVYRGKPKVQQRKVVQQQPKVQAPQPSIEEENLHAIFKAVVQSETNKYTWNGRAVMARYMELSERPIITLLNENMPILVNKIGHLQSMKRALKNKNIKYSAIKWVREWITRVIYNEESLIHSMPPELQELAKITHNIALLQAINNKNVIIHGSFLAHVYNPSIKYADIDLSSVTDDCIYIISLLLYILVGANTHIISVPYIPNHRQLRLNGSDVPLLDGLKSDFNTLSTAENKGLRVGTGYLNTQNPVMQFFNYIKMTAVTDRRKKMRHYVENQIEIMTTLVYNAMKESNIKPGDLDSGAIRGYDISVDLLPNNVIHMRLGLDDEYKDVYMYTGITDEAWESVIGQVMMARTEPAKYIMYSQLGALFPEQRVDTVTPQGFGHETFINISRNDVYRLITELDTGAEVAAEISKISILAFLAIYGIHTFLTRTHAEKEIEDYKRVMVTIMALCQQMGVESITDLFRRTKNEGEHVVKTIFSEKPFIPSTNKFTFANLVSCDHNQRKILIDKRLDINSYHQMLREFAEQKILKRK